MVFLDDDDDDYDDGDDACRLKGTASWRGIFVYCRYRLAIAMFISVITSLNAHNFDIARIVKLI
jgi:hypothetical protein